MLDQLIQIDQHQAQKNANRFFYVHLLAIFVIGCNSQVSNSQRPIWLPFNRDDVVRSLDSGEYVILFGNPLYHTEGKALKFFLESREYTEKIKKSRARLYYLEYTTEEPIADEFMKLTRRTYSPILAILHSDHEPEYFSIDDLGKLKASLERLENPSSR